MAISVALRSSESRNRTGSTTTKVRNMGKFAERMAQQNDLVTSPDGGVSARVVAGGIRNIFFKPGRYDRYTESALEEQLTALAKLAFVARRRARVEAAKEVLGRDTFEERKPRSAKERQLREEQKGLEVEIKTSYFQIRVVGGTRWSLRVRKGTLDVLSEEQFISTLNSAISTAIGQWRYKIQMLRYKIHGPGFETMAFLGKGNNS